MQADLASRADHETCLCRCDQQTVALSGVRQEDWLGAADPQHVRLLHP
jgi:hypothetical protein